VIDQSVEYLLAHQGADSNGLAHEKYRLNAAELECALKKAYERGLDRRWRVYHFPGTPGMWDRPADITELIVKKADQVKAEYFEGDTIRLLTQAKGDKLFSPFKETIGNREVSVSMRSMAKTLDSTASPYEFLQRYLLATGRRKAYEDFKPYHMASVPKNTWTPKMVDEIVEKKVDQVLSQIYDGNLVRMITSTNGIELFEIPLTETIDGHEVRVSMGKIIPHLEKIESPFAMLSRYIQIKGLEKAYWGFRSYHLPNSSKYSWDRKTIDEVLFRKMEQLLHREKYQGDMLRLITEVTIEEIFREPLIDELNGQEVQTNLASLGSGTFEDGVFGALCRYLELKDLTKRFWGFRPFHRQQPMDGYYTQQVCEQLLVRKVDQVLELEFEGDFERMFRYATRKQLLEDPLIDYLDGRPIEVRLYKVK
jgi:hypothetical protein